MPLLSETRWFLQSSLFWEARRALIGQLSSALWLAEYLKHETEMLCHLPYCDAVSWHDDTKTVKPIINEVFVASSGDIITDYNDLYCLFTHRVASRRVNITMSAFVIGETTSTTLHCSKLAFESSLSNSLNMKTYLQAVSQKRQTVLAKLELEAPLYRNSLSASQHCRLLFQVQEIVLHKMCCTHSNIWVELFWNSVVNTT